MSQDARRILHSAYTFVRSIESNKAAAALTLDHVLEEQIAILKKSEVREILDGKGESVGNRISRYDTLVNLEADMTKLVAAMKSAGSDEAKLATLGFNQEVDSK